MKYRIIAGIVITAALIVAYLMFGGRPAAELTETQEQSLTE